MKTDIRFAIRSFRRAPAFFLLAVATLGIGIAANTAIFSLFYQVLLRSLPVRSPEQLVVFHSDPPNLPGGSSADNDETVFSYPMYLRMRDAGGPLAGLAARSSTAVQFVANGTAERGSAEVVTGNFFGVLGIRAHTGRLLGPSDDTVRGGNPVTVLSYAFWRKRFGGSTSILNHTVLLNGNAFTVVGIAPEGFRAIQMGDSPEFFVPISMRAALSPGWNDFDRPDSSWLTLLGRLASGVSREQAAAALEPRFVATVREHVELAKVHNENSRKRYFAKRLTLRPASQGLNSLEAQWRKPLFVLLTMVLLLLVIGCANLANLLMARAVNRSREMAIRFALGAGRARVMRLLLTESALLAIVGTVCGVLLSPVLTRGIIALTPDNELGGWLTGAIDIPLLAFSILLMVSATLLFGVLPAVQATRRAASPLGERTQMSGGSIHAGLRKVLVAGQIALSLALLCTAGLFGRSLANLMLHNPGFRAEHLLSFSVDSGLGGYDTTRGMALYRDLNRRLAGLTGVQSASMAFAGPLSHSHSMSNVTVEGYTPRADEDMMSDTGAVGPAYFRTVGTPLLAGREFDDREIAGAPKVAIVNQAFVKRYLGNRPAIGSKMERGSGRGPDIQIVGVVADSNSIDIRNAVDPMFYVPYEQALQPAPRMLRADFLIRSDRSFESMSGAIRRTMSQIDPSLPVYSLKPMEKNIKEWLYAERLIAALSTAFGLLALLLTAVGLYGVIAYLVSRRTSEIGIRMVLGAEPGSILSMILGEVGVLVLIGGAAGLLGAIAAGRAIQSLLFGMGGVDPLVLTVSAVVLATVALGAAAVPAIRAARIQPLAALRHE